MFRVPVSTVDFMRRVGLYFLVAGWFFIIVSWVVEDSEPPRLIGLMFCLASITINLVAGVFMLIDLRIINQEFRRLNAEIEKIQEETRRVIIEAERLRRLERPPYESNGKGDHDE